MTKYVVPIDTPPPGEDWQTVVPGIYLWDVIGITAQLDTGTATDLLADITGNGNDGTYGTDGPFGAFVAGLIPGADAWKPDAAPVAPAFTNAVIPHPLADWLNPWSLGWFQQYDVAELGGGTSWFNSYDGAAAAIVQVTGQAQAGNPGAQPITVTGGAYTWVAPPDAITADGMPHFVALVWDGTDLTLSVDAIPITWAINAPGPLPTTAAASVLLGNPDVGAGTFAGLGAYGYNLSGAQISTIHAAGQADVATYTSVVLAQSPSALYLLDGPASGTGRQPTLVVSNGTDDVLVIPTGFEAVSTPGPYGYAWQPGLNAGTQSTDGTLTTVAIPALVIPAGYTVGTRTLDIQPTDQWSNVALWWDDSVQQLLGNLDGYEYGAGARLLYHQIGT